MIRRCGDCFALCTPNTAYAFRVTETGHLEHLYYGASLGWTDETPAAEIQADCAAMTERRVFEAGNIIAYDRDHKHVNLEDLRLEMSARGRGDIREPFVAVRHADGSATSDFLFVEAAITPGKAPYRDLPGSYGTDEQVETLTVTLRDSSYDLTMELNYYVYTDCDAICRGARIVNNSSETVTLERLLSTQLDFSDDGWEMGVFHGAWAREMKRQTASVTTAGVVNRSDTGTSSNRSNPFVMLHRSGTSEDSGRCYGLNLIYSGNHYSYAGVNAYGKTRFVSGINPDSFAFLLEPGSGFRAPEAVMVYSGRGFNGMSQQMHRFVREHIVRGYWQHRPRPVLLNSWEAAYFDINESKLLRLARVARDVGVELMVLDDGWFARRDDDAHSLGDWDVNTKKFPGGLTGVCKKVKALGLDFGLWIEPEMVNVDSELYRAHPEWVMEIPGKPHSEGRNQRILDLCNPAVVDHLIDRMTDLISSAEISYVKWDMNRIFSDVYSRYLPPARQGETAHRYVLGLYRLMGTLVSRFPEVLFEGCASGGNRFDLGILCYCPQIWASDNTDALSRVSIQEGYSYGYPLSTVSAHVSACPNHQTLRQTPLMTRYNVAAFGILGYEMNFADLSRSDLEEVKSEVALYKQWRTLLQFGDFYRLRTDRKHKWLCVSPDRKQAVGMVMQELVVPNTQYEDFFAVGLDEDRRYHFYSLPYKFDIRDFGDLVNTVAPVHIRQDSVVHNMLARFLSLPAEVEDMSVSGRVLMQAGVKLAPAYGGTGFNDQTRHFGDFASRLYFMEAEE